MATWTNNDLTNIGDAEEVQIAALRGDGTLRPPVTIWLVRAGDDLFVRSVNGPTAAWYRGTQVRHEGRIWSRGVAHDVTFVDADHGSDEQLDAAYRAKYQRYAKHIVDSIVSPQARAATLKIVPRSPSR